MSRITVGAISARQLVGRPVCQPGRQTLAYMAGDELESKMTVQVANGGYIIKGSKKLCAMMYRCEMLTAGLTRFDVRAK
ncbi:hypothetical protein [Massilia sp. H6]|uniref:hypothetical protein n=1 Tax=Massilia sp. H6 TaxID=2970464 RepID=UPI00216AAAEF|nr:hypothetical protein [Massilia sp. H6]UVW29245.1 hypothetical protein NRS07_03600 [Massilia sp. H6]